MKTTAKFIIGLSVAAAAGAAIGMLLAPEKGKDLQKKLKDEAEDLLDQFTAILKTGKDTVTEIKDAAVDEAGNIRSKIKKAL